MVIWNISTLTWKTATLNAWPWWCPIGGVVSFAVCCLGKKKNEK